MTIDEPLLSAVRAWSAEREEFLAAEGIVLHVDDSRSRWSKPSVVLVLEGQAVISQLTVWGTGEAELEHGEIATGQVIHEHRELFSVTDLHRALADLVRRQREGSGRP
jgi:hypothetical protein